MMKNSLRFSHGTVSRSVKGLETKFTITQDAFYDYKIAHEDFDPDDAFLEMIQKFHQLQDILKSPLSSSQKAAFDDYILESLASMVYGSNLIENAGAGFEITWNLCMKIFKGEPVPEEISERDEEYQRIRAERLKAKLPTNSMTVLRTRREIFQHAKAAAYIINSLCLKDHELSEDIILETHRILTYKVDAESAPWSQYSGVYRSVNVTAGLTSFATVSSIPSKMKDMIKQLQYDLDMAKKSGNIDPIMLAAKYSHIFVNIHPFLDGNGRMCRLMLNAILLKLGNFIVCLGEDATTRDQYLEVVTAASQLEATYDGREEEEKPVMHREVASLVLSYAKASLGKLIKTVAK